MKLCDDCGIPWTGRGYCPACHACHAYFHRHFDAEGFVQRAADGLDKLGEDFVAGRLGHEQFAAASERWWIVTAEWGLDDWLADVTRERDQRMTERVA